MLRKKSFLAFAFSSLFLATTSPCFAATPDPAPVPAPVPGGILMVGSSILQNWATAATDLAPLPVANRAFGGSQTADQLKLFDKIVPSSQAAFVVWYCGSNDVNLNKTVDEILQNTQDWVTKTRAALPQAHIVLLSVIRAPQKRESGFLPLVDDINKRLQALATGTTGVSYLDVNPSLEDAAGESVADCYVADKLHLTPEAYRRMGRVLLPLLQKEQKAPAKQ